MRIAPFSMDHISLEFLKQKEYDLSQSRIFNEKHDCKKIQLQVLQKDYYLYSLCSMHSSKSKCHSSTLPQIKDLEVTCFVLGPNDE